MQFTPLVFYKIICDIVRSMPMQIDKAGNSIAGERINTFVLTNERDYYILPESDNLRRTRRYMNSGVFYSRINENTNQQSPNLIAYEYPLCVLVPLSENYSIKGRSVNYMLNIMDNTQSRDLPPNSPPNGDFLLSEIGLEKLANLYQILAASINDFVFATATFSSNPVFSKWIAQKELLRLKSLGVIDNWDTLNFARNYTNGLLDKAKSQQSEDETSRKLIAYVINFDIQFQIPCAQPIENYNTQFVQISQKTCCD